MKLSDIIKDIETQIKVSNNENYKARLMEAYQTLKFSNIKNVEDFKKTDIGVGAYSYQELTFFERMNNEKYAQFIISSAIGIISSYKSAVETKDLGDRISSFGTIGETPYREEYIKNGYITDLTDEETKKYK